MSKRVNISVDLGALQAAIGDWPGVDEVATRLGKGQRHVHGMLDDGRLKGIRTRVGWIVHPACVERVAREENNSQPDRPKAALLLPHRRASGRRQDRAGPSYGVIADRGVLRPEAERTARCAR